MIKEENINCTVEALILASPEPVSLNKLNEVMDGISPARIRQAIVDLNNLYMGAGISFRIREVAGGYQVHILPDFEQAIKNMLSKQRTVRLTRAALETLAIIAYKQPVAKNEIEHIRGVSSDGVLHNLLERKLIVIAGRSDGPGRPLLYKTAAEFLKFFGLNRLTDLPRIEEIEEMIREAEPSKDQTELDLAEASRRPLEGLLPDAGTEDKDDDSDDHSDDMIAHVDAGIESSDMVMPAESETTDDGFAVDDADDASDLPDPEADDEDDDEENEIFGADYDPGLMSEIGSEHSIQDDRPVGGGNGNGNGNGSDLPDDDTPSPEKPRMSAMLYLSGDGGDDDAADESESSEVPVSLPSSEEEAVELSIEEDRQSLDE